MFSFFRKEDKKKSTNVQSSFEIELTAAVLAYEIARSDGEISNSELSVIMEEIEKIAKKVGKEKVEIYKIVETYSKDSVSFYEFIEDINTNYLKEQKFQTIQTRLDRINNYWVPQ